MSGFCKLCLCNYSPYFQVFSEEAKKLEVQTIFTKYFNIDFQSEVIQKNVQYLSK